MRGRGAPQQNANNFISYNQYNYNDDDDDDDEEIDVLNELGFEEDELEMFFEERPNGDQDELETELINKYFEIARQPPFNRSWRTLDDAIDAEYLFISNNREYSKHDIVNDVFASYSESNGGKRKKNKKSRKSKKQRKSKSKKHNVRRTKRYRK